MKFKLMFLLLVVCLFILPASAHALVKNYGPCTLQSASWDRGTAAVGDIVTLKINSTGECINFTTTPSQPRSVVIQISGAANQPGPINLLSNGASTSWQVESGGPYTFTVTLSGTPNQVVTSAALSVVGTNTQTTYYIDPVGSNSNSGTSPAAAWLDFTNLTSRTLTPGQRVLLKRGGVWNQQLTLNGSGNPTNFIEVSAYGSGARPKICRTFGANGQRAMRMQGMSYVRVSSIEVCDGDAGIMMYYNNQYENRSMHFNDILGHGFTGHYEDYTAEVSYSYAIGFAGNAEWAPHVILKDLRVTDSEFYNNNTAVWISWKKNANLNGYFSGAFTNALVQNVFVHDNSITGTYTGGTYAGIAISTCTACQFRDVIFDRATRDAGSGTSAIFFGGSYNSTIDRSTFLRTPAATDGTAIDFESWTHGTSIQNTWFEENAGGAMEFFNNGGDNFGTQIKNNVFVNNGSSRYFAANQAQIVVADWPGATVDYANVFNNFYSYSLSGTMPFINYGGTVVDPAASFSGRFFLCDNNAAYVYPLGASQTPTACGSTTNTSSLPATFPSSNQPPVVSITSPADESNYVADANWIIPAVTFTASASDPDGSISKVEFVMSGTYQTSYNYATAPGAQQYRWEMPIPCVDTTAPYSTAGCTGWTSNFYRDRIDDANPEKLWVVAKATDNLGYTTTSWATALNLLPSGSPLPTATPTPANVTPTVPPPTQPPSPTINPTNLRNYLINYSSVNNINILAFASQVVWPTPVPSTPTPTPVVLVSPTPTGTGTVQTQTYSLTVNTQDAFSQYNEASQTTNVQISASGGAYGQAWVGRDNAARLQGDAGWLWDTTIPMGSTIQSATVTLNINGGYQGPMNTRWSGYKVTNPTNFSTSETTRLSARHPLTTANLALTAAQPNANNVYTTPNLATIVQEIVNQPGFTGRIGLVWQNLATTGDSWFEYVDYSTSAPLSGKLTVTFGGGAVATPTSTPIPGPTATPTLVPTAVPATPTPTGPTATPAPVSGEWTQHAHDAQHTSYSPNQIPTTLSVAWPSNPTWNGSDSSGGLAAGHIATPKMVQPITGGGRVYIPYGSGVVALDELTGAQIWNKTPGGNLTTSAAYDYTTTAVYVTSSNGNVYKLNPATGATLGSVTTNGAITTSPLLAAGYLYVVSPDRMYKINPATMAIVWTHQANSPLRQVPAYSASQDILIVGTANTTTNKLQVLAVNNTTGQQAWRTNINDVLTYDPIGIFLNRGDEYAEVYDWAAGWPVVVDNKNLVLMQLRSSWYYEIDGGLRLATNSAYRTALDGPNRTHRKLYALFLDTGLEAFTTVVQNAGFNNSQYSPMGPQPVIKTWTNGSNIDTVAYTVTYNSTANGPCTNNTIRDCGAAFAELVLDNTTIPGYQAGDVRLIRSNEGTATIQTDEHGYMSMAGDMFFYSHWAFAAGHRITNRADSLGMPYSAAIQAGINSIGDPNLVLLTENNASGTCSFNASTHYCSGLVGFENGARSWNTGGFYVYRTTNQVYNQFWTEGTGVTVSNNRVYFKSNDGSILVLQ
jgi:hypothetical protein